MLGLFFQQFCHLQSPQTVTQCYRHLQSPQTVTQCYRLTRCFQRYLREFNTLNDTALWIFHFLSLVINLVFISQFDFNQWWSYNLSKLQCEDQCFIKWFHLLFEMHLILLHVLHHHLFKFLLYACLNKNGSYFSDVHGGHVYWLAHGLASILVGKSSHMCWQAHGFEPAGWV